MKMELIKIYDDYFELIPGDIQKLVMKYMTNAKEIEKMNEIYPKFINKIYNSIEEFGEPHQPKGLLQTKFVEHKIVDIEYIKKFKNIKRINYHIYSLKNIEEMTDIPCMNSYDIMVPFDKFNIESLEYIFKICRLYLTINTSILDNIGDNINNMPYLKIYNNKFEPIFIYESGILEINVLTEDIWKLLEKYHCKTKGITFVQTSNITENLNFVNQQIKKIYKNNNDEKCYFDYLGVDYLNCCSPEAIDQFLTLIKDNKNITKLEFNSNGYGYDVYPSRDRLNNKFISNLKKISKSINISQKINISFDNIVGMDMNLTFRPNYISKENNILNEKFILKLFEAFSSVFINIDKFYFTPIIRDHDSLIDTFHVLDLLNNNPSIISMKTKGIKFYFNPDVYKTHNISKEQLLILNTFYSGFEYI